MSREKVTGLRALVTGATGFVGRRLVERLERPRILGRDLERARLQLGGDVDAFVWKDPHRERPPAAAFEGVDVVFHLAGEPVAGGRWTAERKEAIHESRRLGTRHLVEAMAAASPTPPVLVSSSAIGYYGDRGSRLLDETSANASDFLGTVCRDWEIEALKARAHGVRVACLRIGIVLGDGGGALDKMVLPFRLGVGGRLGSGRQWMSWIHLDDVVGLLLHAATDERLSGPVNATAPGPVSNREFTRTLGRVLGRPTLLPAPALGLRLALGEFSEVLLGGQRVRPRVAEETGYEFRHPALEGALRSILDPTA